MNSAVTPWFQFRTKMDQNPSRKPVVRPGRHARSAPRNSPRLIQRSFFRAQWFDLSLFHISYSVSASLATGLLLCWHAVPLAEQQKKIQDQDDHDCGVPCRRGMGARLWRRKRSASSIDRRDRKTGDRVFGAWRSSDLYGGGNKHNRRCRRLERQRRAQWQHDGGNDHIRRRVHRACRPAFARHRANHRYQSCRPGKIRHWQSRNYERHHAELDPESPADAVHHGSISGRISPANPLALPASPPGVTSVFGAQVVAVDAASGAVVGATLGGWSCSAPGPPQFDGSYEIDGLAVGRSYTIYAEALNGAVDPSQFINAVVSLCRNTVRDPGWPPLQGCVVPAVNTSFTTRTRPGP